MGISDKLFENRDLEGKCTIKKNYAKYDLNTIKNKYVTYFFKIIFLYHSSKIYFFLLELVIESKEMCQEEVNGMLGEGKKSGIINCCLLYDEF